jgi:hypothetical protein
MWFISTSVVDALYCLNVALQVAGNWAIPYGFTRKSKRRISPYILL